MSEVMQHQIKPESLCAMFGAGQNLKLPNPNIKLFITAGQMSYFT